ncbi:MAG: protein translocase subunit SecF [Acutalibacteraceae bacterium]
MKKFNIDFYGHRKVYFIISAAIMVVGLLCNILFGTELSTQFRGGTILKYSYSGDMDTEQVAQIAKDVTGTSAEVTINENVQTSAGSDTVDQISLNFAGTGTVDPQTQRDLLDQLQAAFPDSNVQLGESSSVDATMGAMFFAKCMVAILLAAILLILYVAIRFKKIGGMSAGVTGVIALIHDVLVVYFVFVIFRMPLNDSFIAVVLTILGYSLNDTIVLYDRLRENRRVLGPKVPYEEQMNVSINQNFTRCLNTSITTFAAITVVYVVGLAYGLDSVTSFALPMMFGVISGCYSSLCISCPLYVIWQNHKKKKRAAAGAKA